MTDHRSTNTQVQTRKEVPRITRQGSPPPRSTPPGGGGGFTGKDFLRVLRRHWLKILVCLMLFVGLSVGGTYFWLQRAPFYTAEALLKVKPEEISALRNLPQSTNQDMIERMLITRASLVKTEGVLNEAVENDSYELKKTDWYGRHRHELVEELNAEVHASPVQQSQLLKISMTSTDRKSLPVVVNAVANAAVEMSNKTSSHARQRNINQLRSERANYADQLQTLRSQIKEKRKNIETGGYKERSLTLEYHVRDLIPRRNELQTQRDALKKELAFLESQVDSGAIASHPEILRALNYDPEMSQLRSNQVALSTQVEGLESRLGPNHRDVRRAASSLGSVENKLQQKEQEIVQEQAQSLLDARRNMLDTVVSQLVAAEEKLTQVSGQLRDIQNTMGELEQEEKRAEVLTERLGQLDDQLLELDLLKDIDRPLEMAEPARPPRIPTMPKWKIMIPLGVLLGLVAGVGLALMLELIDTSIRNPSDIGRRINLPLLGIVPHLDDLEDDMDDVRLASLTAPQSMIGEAFRNIRTNLLFSGPAEQRRSLLVTSPSPEDGRTTVAVNLASAVAQSGRRVLLVDSNFRQPAIRELFPETPEGGLSSALVGQGDWRDMVSEVRPNLEVMGAGPLPPSPADLLGSEQMDQLLSEMLERYDQVIFDGAPGTVVSDPTVLATRVDGVIFVVRAHTNTHGIVQRTKEGLDRVGATILGAVLNGVRSTPGGYLRKNYAEFYDYHERPELPSGKS